MWKEAITMMLLKKDWVFNKEITSEVNGIESNKCANVSKQHLNPLRQSWQLHLPSELL